MLFILLSLVVGSRVFSQKEMILFKLILRNVNKKMKVFWTNYDFLLKKSFQYLNRTHNINVEKIIVKIIAIYSIGL